MLSASQFYSSPPEKFSLHLLGSGVRGQGQQEDTPPTPDSSTDGCVKVILGLLDHIPDRNNQYCCKSGGKRAAAQQGVVTDMRMSCALSRSLLLVELTKMPSSSAMELLDDKRLCRPTRPFQPRPGEALQTEAAPRFRTFTSHFTRAASTPDVSLVHVCLHFDVIKLTLRSKFHVRPSSTLFSTV